MENNNKDNMSKQLDAQILELEQRFNQFLKELEEDFDFVPSAVSNKNAKDEKDDEYYPEFDHRLADMEKKYANVDKKYTIVLFFTTLLMLSVLGYLGYVLFGKH
jgi:hypothetical protein